MKIIKTHPRLQKNWDIQIGDPVEVVEETVKLPPQKAKAMADLGGSEPYAGVKPTKNGKFPGMLVLPRSFIGQE